MHPNPRESRSMSSRRLHHAVTRLVLGGGIEVAVLLATTALMWWETIAPPTCERLPEHEVSRLTRGAVWREVRDLTATRCKHEEEPSDGYPGTIADDCLLAVGSVTVRLHRGTHSARQSYSWSMVDLRAPPLVFGSDLEQQMPFCVLDYSHEGIPYPRSGTLYHASAGEGVELLRCEQLDHDHEGPKRFTREAALRRCPTPPGRVFALLVAWGSVTSAFFAWRRGFSDEGRWRKALRAGDRWFLDDGREVSVTDTDGEEVLVLLGERESVKPYREGAVVPVQVKTQTARERDARVERTRWVARCVAIALLGTLAAWGLRAWSLR